LILVGCTSSNLDKELNHIGCQEDEIDENGNCIVAEDNNANIFEQNTEDFVKTKELNEDFYGYLAKPKEEGTYPGIIMIHEWWGLNDNIKEMAQILAKEGYVVLAIDLYNNEVAENSSKARELATSVRTNPEEAIKTMKKGIEYLRNEENVQKVGSLGWCFGGQQSLQISLNEKLDATVIYYGQLIDDEEQLSFIENPVLGIFGSEDSSITVESVNSFEKSLNNLGIENEIVIYDGVGHAFANPSGSNYAKEETIDAWDKTLNFLNSNLK